MFPERLAMRSSIVAVTVAIVAMQWQPETQVVK